MGKKNNKKAHNRTDSAPPDSSATPPPPSQPSGLTNEDSDDEPNTTPPASSPPAHPVDPSPEPSAVEKATETLESLPSLPPNTTPALPPTSNGTPRASLDLRRASLDSDSPQISSGGRPSLDEGPSGEKPTDDVDVATVRKLLDRTKAEKDQLEKQYKALVGKVGNMKETLGKKLREDAEELDRREAQITTLTTELSHINDDQAVAESTIQTLRSELQSQARETSSLSTELSQLRLQVTSSSDETLHRTRELRDLQAEMENIRLEKEEWESVAGKERERADEEEVRGKELELGLRRTEEALAREKQRAKREQERGNNLQDVLEEFQVAKEAELSSAVSELEMHLRNTITSLADWKLRASIAETRVEELKQNASQSQAFAKEIKEKNVLIGKLRHENVIMNEHLTEALRRLRKNSSDTNVDRRLITNILLSFLSAPRGDPKKFEMLSLLSSILSWTDIEREQAGLQRVTGTGKRAQQPARKFEKEEDPVNETFSQLFVEYLLKEASSGAPILSPTLSATTPPPLALPSPSTRTTYPFMSPSRSRPSSVRGSSSQNSPMHSPKLAAADSPPGSPTISPPSRPRIGSASYFSLEQAFGQGKDRKA